MLLYSNFNSIITNYYFIIFNLNPIVSYLNLIILNSNSTIF